MLVNRVGAIGRTYRHIQRYKEILGVMFKFGFGDLVTSLNVEQYLDFGRKLIFREKKEKIESYTRAERLRMALEELGPTFIKLGQMLSTRPDILSADFIHELVKLQDEVPPFSFAEVKAIIESELPGTINDVFSFVDPVPLAAASIGQVHRARMINNIEVVIKVQRPGIRRTVQVDLEILMHLASLIERHVEGWDIHRPTEVVDEFRKTLEMELDYQTEAANMTHLTGMYYEDPRVYIPKVYQQVSTTRILTMEFVNGIKADNLAALKETGFDLPDIASLGADLVIEQTLVKGFFHADPHPGNLLVLPGPIICFLDMGMMGRIDRTTRENLVDLCLGVVRKEANTMVNAILSLTEWSDEPDRRRLGRDLTLFIDRYLNRPLKDLQLSSLLQEVFEIAVKYRLRTPADLLLLIKALSVIESLGRQLDPDFNIIQKVAPVIEKIHLERYHPRRFGADLWDYAVEVIKVLKDAPSEIRSLLRSARRGKLKIELEHHGLEHLRSTVERTGNRLSFAVVLAAMIIGSSMLVRANIPPTWHDIPLIGLAGYLISGIMGIWLLITIIRGGMM
jgi:ubiquinone biosynthesis protein